MPDFERTIGRGEARNYYLNLTDNRGNHYGSRFPPDRSRLWLITEGRRYSANQRGVNQIWGNLRRWFEQENVHAGDTVRIKYDPLSGEIDGRVPIEVSVLNRRETVEAPSDIVEVEEEEIGEPTESPAQVDVQMERDLEDFLANNLNLVEEGLELYTDEQGRDGRQYLTDVGAIDLLCKNQEDFVVIELKKARSSDVVVGQISRYIGWVRENLSEGHIVRGIIIVHDFDPRLKYAVLAHENLELKYYEIQIKFVSEQEIIDKLP